MLSLPLSAQETYENAKIAQEDLNGTARYVGMGGAMEALGADLSTISTNPAGVGLFRHSSASVSGGLVVQNGGHEFDGGNKTNASFDQVGFVYSLQTRKNSFVNFSFNYHKSRNFDFILNATGRLNNASQNKQAYIKNVIGNENKGGYYIDQDQNTGEYIGYVNENSPYIAYTWSELDYLYWNSVIPDAQDNGTPYYYNADSYDFNRKHTGYIGNYDFNISGNIHDRVFLGVTFGIKDVHYHGYSLYQESMPQYGGGVSIYDRRKITGTGFDVTVGAIVRPIDNSPFRIGVYVKTPTWYDLTTKNYTTLYNGIPSENGGLYDNASVWNSYDYKIYTQWKFGVSLGHTIADYLALGATYEYEDYGSISSRVNDYDDWDDYYYDDEPSHKDHAMSDHTSHTLKGVSTLKLGIEGKPTKNLSLRAGYNYVSPVFEKHGQKDPGVPSYGTVYSSASDFVNWKSTNRITFGIGYQIDKFNIDLAYQYSTQKGDFYPFSSTSGSYSAVAEDGTKTQVTETNSAPSTEVKNIRSQFIATLSYHF